MKWTHSFSNSVNRSSKVPICCSNTSSKSARVSSWTNLCALQRARVMFPFPSRVAMSLRIIRALASFFACSCPSSWIADLSWVCKTHEHQLDEQNSRPTHLGSNWIPSHRSTAGWRNELSGGHMWPAPTRKAGTSPRAWWKHNFSFGD